MTGLRQSKSGDHDFNPRTNAFAVREMSALFLLDNRYLYGRFIVDRNGSFSCDSVHPDTALYLQTNGGGPEHWQICIMENLVACEHGCPVCHGGRVLAVAAKNPNAKRWQHDHEPCPRCFTDADRLENESRVQAAAPRKDSKVSRNQQRLGV